MCVVYVTEKGHSGDICDWESTLSKYNLRKGDLFVLSWGSIIYSSFMLLLSTYPSCV